MRAISAVFVCLALVACDSSETKESSSSEAGDASTKADSTISQDDASVVAVDPAAPVEDAEVASLDAADNDVDASQSTDAEIDAELPDASVADTSVVDTAVPDASVPDATVVLTPDQMLEARVTAKMRMCGVLAATGDFKANKVVDQFDRCLSNCYLRADIDCAELLAFHCGTPGPDAQACVDACGTVPSDGFHCATGSQVIPHIFVCDGMTADCTESTCQFPGCYDESEELNCPTLSCLVKGLPSNLLNSYVCDGYSDCDDNKDEVGCATLCPGG